MFRARKLNATMLGRAYKANLNSSLGNVYRLATDGPGRRTNKSMFVRARRNPLVRNSPFGDCDYRKEKRSYVMEFGSKEEHTAASRITGSCTRVDTFLKSTPGTQAQRDIRRKLLLWRIGVLPGKPQQCQKSECSAVTTRDHVIECSGLKRDIEAFVQPAQLRGDNILDVALNNAKIWRIPKVWTIIKKGLQTVWSKCLGRIWYSGHERSPGVERKVCS